MIDSALFVGIRFICYVPGMIRVGKGTFRFLTGFMVCWTGIAGLSAQESPVRMGPDGHLIYMADERGNRIPDFSYCGYQAGEQPVPDVPVRILVPVKEGDATRRIQSALDYVASLPGGRDGFRGAVLLEKGRYDVQGSLRMSAPGVVLRGSGMGEDGTLLVGSGKTREILIRIRGEHDRMLDSAEKITNAYVPVGAFGFRVEAPHSFQAGDTVRVHRPATQKWIRELGMEEFGGESGWLGWKPGERDLYWDRTITAVNGDSLTLDAPLTTALDTAYGGGTIAACSWPGRISRVGVENLRCRSEYDAGNPKDEEHPWMGITLENVQDAWVRQVVFEHFAGSAVAVWETACRVTVEDCKSLAPVSEIGGQRRYAFFTMGQQTLFQRCYSEQGYHDFAAGFCAAGPNAFVQCEARLPYSFSGTIDSWASGVLFDLVNIDGQPLSLRNRGADAQGAGWTAANCVLWQCTAARVDCYRPPTAHNWAFGIWARFAGDGYWEESNSHIEPRSLYYAQLADRLGGEATERAYLLPLETSATSSPTIEQAAELSSVSSQPAPLLTGWIDQAAERQPVSLDADAAVNIDELQQQATDVRKAGGLSRQNWDYRLSTDNPASSESGQDAGKAPSLQVKNGWLVRGDAVLTGKRQGVQWWRGDARPYGAQEATPHITRFVPGRTGTGYTDDLEEVAGWMKQQGILALEHNYGLWYDRRRDDHERVRRMNGEVWPPFYELPFARSGEGTAWDGLSKYDLTRYNPWYWKRLKQFAGLADQKGLVLIHQQYFQHNILEAGAHWADFPWRPANNINDTGFPEPPPYAGDKRIFMAEQFYDTTHPVRRKLHRAYIRQCLENFRAGSGVIQLTSAEYTGPLHFVQFWLDTIREWEKETGREALTGLSTTKDVQDSILADPTRAGVPDLIDIRYWHYRDDGSLYAPLGGQNLAPRQHARLVKTGKQSFQQVYRAVREYREKYPDKAILYSTGDPERFAWAVFMAGGSMAAIPPVSDPDFLASAAGMRPADLPGNPSGQWVLENARKERILYSGSPAQIRIDLAGVNGEFRVRRFDPETGRFLPDPEIIPGGKVTELKHTRSGPLLLWISRTESSK